MSENNKLLNRLDNVLMVFAESTTYQIEKSVPIAVLLDEEIKHFSWMENGKQHELTDHEFNLIIQKLVDDNYVIRRKNLIGNYETFITFEGRLFHEEGGYSKKYRDVKWMKKNQTVLSRLTWTIAIGTAIAAVYHAQQFYISCKTPITTQAAPIVKTTK